MRAKLRSDIMLIRRTVYNLLLEKQIAWMSALYQAVQQKLQMLQQSGIDQLLVATRIGLEKESLRVSHQGGIALTPHPRVLGSALTHPYITTDYSEALLELITPPMDSVREALDFLHDIQTFVYRNIHDEFLWATSMPCVLNGEENIPIAQYGSSNPGMMKTVYRRGLGYRYGKTMQVIAGVHFNYSFPEAFWQAYQQQLGDGQGPRAFVDQQYFGLIRNLLRLGWVIPYLFGASPAVCKSFFAGNKPETMDEFNENTFYEPHATSLRMGDIGYTNAKEGETGVHIDYSGVDEYVDSLSHAIETPCPDYERIGVEVDGYYRQLNSNLLQIENEYYSSVRPKQVLETMEKPTMALKRRGVQYVELRSLDVNAFDPLGINESQLYFLEVFMTFCLLQESPRFHPGEHHDIDFNQSKVAHQGRDPQLILVRDGKDIALHQWLDELLAGMQGVAQMLDRIHQTGVYTKALAEQQAISQDTSQTPSARMLQMMRDNNEGFYHHAQRMSQQHYDYFRNQTLSPEREQMFRTMAAESLQKQQAMESARQPGFAEFLDQYFAQKA